MIGSVRSQSALLPGIPTRASLAAITSAKVRSLPSTTGPVAAGWAAGFSRCTTSQLASSAEIGLTPTCRILKEIDGYFQTYYQQSMIKTDLGATEKYRYVPNFNTGGTFGVNMHTVEEKLLSFNYQSIYAAPAERLEQHKNFIVEHYLKQFNEEIIQPKNFNHCGEPCSVVCKKYNGKFKKDYEPYQALGPLIGVFDQRASEELNRFRRCDGAKFHPDWRDRRLVNGTVLLCHHFACRLQLAASF